MPESNKVVIKINYTENDSNIKSPEPKLITEWNLKRIFYTLAIITALLLTLILFLTGIFDEKTIEPSKNKLQVKEKSVITKEIAINPVSNSNNLNPIIIDTNTDPKQLTNISVNKPSINNNITPTTNLPLDNIKKNTNAKTNELTPLTSDSRITRALLTSKIKNKEPVDIFTSPISIIKGKAIELYYYTEIINMKDQALYHHWIWGNKSIYTKKIKIGGNRWRASTSKLIQASKAGEWTVRLLNEDNIILNEIKFEVIKK